MGCFAFVKMFLTTCVTDYLKLVRDVVTCMNAKLVIIMSSETQLTFLLSGKKMYLEVKRTSRTWPKQNTSANSVVLRALPQTHWTVV